MAATSEQIEIINAPIDRHIKVAAVAGSGKSFTLIRRIIHMIEQGVSPETILVLMFNKSAQKDFSKRIRAAMPDGPWPTVVTYHSLGNSVCKVMDKEAGQAGQWTNATKDYQVREVAKQAIKEAQDAIAPGGKQPHNQLVDEFTGFVDMVKSLASTPARVMAEGNYDAKADIFPDAYKRFEVIRKERKIRFFSDLIYDPICYIVANKKSFSSLLGPITHCVIDEYQDINLSSHILIDGVCGNNTKLTVVGDDDQTIYEFRGSNPNFLIHTFQERFKNPLCFTLTKTFRYGHAVSMLANNVIRNNESRIPKMCISSDTAPATSISMYFESSPGTEIANIIKARKAEGYAIADMAILIRGFASAPALEITLLEEEIPYHIDGHETVTQSREIRFLTTLALYARGEILPGDHAAKEALSFLFNMPMIGVKIELGRDVAAALVAGTDTASVLARHASSMHEFTKSLVMERLSILSTLRQSASDKTPLELVEFYLYKTAYYESLKKASSNDTKSDEMEQTITAWANFVATCGEPDQSRAMMRFQSMKPADPENSLLITSVHRSKGLEWPVVILPDIRQNVFPYKPKSKDFSIESERRLFYVACTRAQKNLTIVTSTDSNYTRALREGRTLPPIMDEKAKNQASTFLYEANIGVTGRVVAAIKAGQPARIIAPADVDIAPFNDYLKRINSPITVERDLSA